MQNNKNIGSNMKPKLSLSIAVVAAALAGAGASANAQTLTHRYSFNDPAGSATFVDSVGGADGSLDNTAAANSALLDGSKLVLDGQGGYALLPGHLIDGYNALTVEFWADIGPNIPTWTRVFAFGSQTSSLTKESGLDYSPYAPGGTLGWQNLDEKDLDGTVTYVNNNAGLRGSNNVHVTVILDYDNINLQYFNGTKSLSSAPTSHGPITPISGIVDNVNWLGRSLSDADAKLTGAIHEFRIYEGALTPQQVAINDAAGSGNYVPDAGAFVGLSLPNSTNVAGTTAQQPLRANFENVSGVDLWAYDGAGVVIESLNPEIATVSGSGAVTALAPGTADLVATYNGVSVTNEITVVEDPHFGLVSWWPLESADGGIAQDYIYTNNLNGVNGPAVAPGVFGNSYTFNGTSQYASLVHGNNNTISGLPIFRWSSGNTVAFWVKGPPQTDKYVFSEGSSTNNNTVYKIGSGNTAASNSKLDIWLRGDGNANRINHTNSFATVFDNTWHHVAVTDDRIPLSGTGNGGTIRIYIDGALDRSFAWDSGSYTYLDTTSIGALAPRVNAATGFFNGQVDDVAVWKRPLSQSEINAVKNGSLGALPPVAVTLAIAINSGGNLELSWPSNAAGYTLQSATSLNSPNWQAVSETPVSVADRQVVTLAPTGGQQFFRLIH